MKKYGLILFLGMFFTIDIVSAASYEKIVCGTTDIPYIAAQITSTVIDILKIITPVIIIVLGMIDLLKAVMAQKEDDIKKGQQTFIKRLVVGISVFLVFFLVEIIIGFVAPQNTNRSMWQCVDCFVNGNCSAIRK